MVEYSAMLILITLAGNILIPLPFALEAYGQSDILTVTTDSDNYSLGDAITISGHLDRTPIDQPLLIQVLDPQGNRDRIDQLNAAADGTYSYTFVSGGTMNTHGTYTVRVTFGGSIQAETTFAYAGGSTIISENIIYLIIDGQHYPIQQKISGSGNSIIDISAGLNINSTFPGGAKLVVTLNAPSDGELSLRFPEDTFDASGNFTAFVDGTAVEVVDQGYDSTNLISIHFKAGSHEIQIIGDHIIPEFGSLLAAIVGVMSFAGVILATKLRPKVVGDNKAKATKVASMKGAVGR